MGWIVKRTTVIGLIAVAGVILVSVIAYQFHGVKAEAVLSSTVRGATPLLLAALCGLLGERTGVVNIGIEGQILMSAFTAFFTASVTGSLMAGLVAGMLSGALLGLFLALCAVTWQIDQIIAGTVINIFAAGITSFLYTQGRTLPKQWPTWDLPVLSGLPVFGKIFQLGPITYVALILVVVLHVGLFHTSWGLRGRAVGEHPSSAETVGVSVVKTRYRNVTMAGLFGGLAGSFLSLEAVGTFERGMSNGRGFTALAIMIFGRWYPAGALVGALFFAFTTALAAQLQFNQVIDIPAQFVNMLPFVLVIVVLAVFSAKVRPPAAVGKPYTRGEE
jgi:general nucleoside transport system permease protein